MTAGQLIDQFEAACRDWSERAGDTLQTDTTTWIMMALGGFQHYQTVDKVDTSNMSKQEKDDLTVGQTLGHHTSAQAFHRIGHLIENEHLEETFLIHALIEYITRELERLSEDYAKGIQRRRRVLEFFEEVRGDPELRAAHPELAFESEAREIAAEQFFRRMAEPSLNDMRKNRRLYEAWRELTDPISEASDVQL